LNRITEIFGKNAGSGYSKWLHYVLNFIYCSFNFLFSILIDPIAIFNYNFIDRNSFFVNHLNSNLVTSCVKNLHANHSNA